MGLRLVAELYPWLIREGPSRPTFHGPFPATRRMLVTTLRTLLSCRSPEDIIAFLDTLNVCAEHAYYQARGRAPVFALSQRVVWLTCELTVIYFPW